MPLNIALAKLRGWDQQILSAVPVLTVAVAGRGVDVCDFELEIGVAGLRDDALDQQGGDASAHRPPTELARTVVPASQEWVGG
jgi:hypothetical protein